MIGTNNPFNIRNNKRNKWCGQTGSKRGFCCFKDRKYGIRAAMIIVMQNYRNNGFVTIQDIINRFAPSSENDTDSYIRFVVSKTRISPLRRLNSQAQYFDVLAAMSVFEGNQVYFYELVDCFNSFKIGFKIFDYEEENVKVD